MQNGVALYATWGTLCTLLSLTIFLQHDSGASRCDCAMLSLLLLLMTLLAWWASLLRSVTQLLPSTHPLLGDPLLRQQNHSFLSSSSPLTPRFLLENFWLDKHMRYIVTTHPVVILWLAGTLSNSDSPGSQVYIFTGSVWHPHTWSIHFFSVHCLLIYVQYVFYLFFPFTASILALSALMFVVRIALIVWRHYKQPLYSSSEPNLSPVEIALTQRKLFLWSFIQLSLFWYCFCGCNPGQLFLNF